MTISQTNRKLRSDGLISAHMFSMSYHLSSVPESVLTVRLLFRCLLGPRPAVEMEIESDTTCASPERLDPLLGGCFTLGGR